MNVAALMMAAALAATPVTLKFEGPLNQALQQLADKGGLNVIASGDLSEVVQVNLHDVSAEEAMDTLASAYSIEVKKQGKVWLVRGKPVKVEAAAPVAKVAPVAPLPPLPPMTFSWPLKAPVPPGSQDTEADDSQADATEAAREAQQEAREAALEAEQEAREAAQEAEQDLRDKQQELKDRLNETKDAQKELAEAHAKLQEARARAHDIASAGPLVVKANEVVDSAVSYGGPVVIEENAVVTGNAVAFGGDVVLKENARVEGDAVSFGGQVVRGANSTVAGESLSMAGSTLGTVISKQVVKEHTDSEAKSRGATKGDDHDRGTSVAGFLLKFAALFVLGFLLTLFAPQRMHALEASIRSEPLANGVVGLVALAAAVPMSGILLVTVVGIPVVLVFWLGAGLLAPFGLSALGSVLGGVIPSGSVRKTQALVLAIGLLALVLAWQIPVLGWVLLFASVFLSMGAIIRTRFGQPRPGLVTADPHVVDATPAT